MNENEDYNKASLVVIAVLILALIIVVGLLVLKSMKEDHKIGK